MRTGCAIPYVQGYKNLGCRGSKERHRPGQIQCGGTSTTKEIEPRKLPSRGNGNPRRRGPIRQIPPKPAVAFGSSVSAYLQTNSNDFKHTCSIESAVQPLTKAHFCNQVLGCSCCSEYFCLLMSDESSMTLLLILTSKFEVNPPPPRQVKIKTSFFFLNKDQNNKKLLLWG